MTDVVVVGGGIIGLSIAYELAGQGVAVWVLEQGDFGREASWAAAGMLPPGNANDACDPEAWLRGESHRLWPELSDELLGQTGIDNGFRECGGIELRTSNSTDDLQAEIENWKAEGVAVEQLTADKLLEYEPELCQNVTTGYRLSEMRQLRSPWHLKALLAGCRLRGVELLAGAPVVGFETHEGVVRAARTSCDSYRADRFCIAGGAWSRQLLAGWVPDIAVEPVRGQIVLLSAPTPLVQHAILNGPRYVVPRPDGKMLIGSTEEWVGFEKRNTAAAVSELIRFGTDLVPALAGARFERTWCGLRPGSPDGLPFLDRVPKTDNLFVAAGHFRSGIQQSPATALLMRQLMLGQEPSIPLDGFSCRRQHSNSLDPV